MVASWKNMPTRQFSDKVPDLQGPVLYLRLITHCSVIKLRGGGILQVLGGLRPANRSAIQPATLGPAMPATFR